MVSELLHILENATVASSCGILLTLLLRKPLRAYFGSSLAYFLWLLVPTALLVLLLPVPSTGPTSVFPVSLSLSMSSLTSQVARVSTSSDRGLNWAMWLVCAWGVGVLLFCARVVYQQRRFIASLGGLVRSDDVLRAAHSAGCPVVFGVVRPRIVVPSDFTIRYPPEEQVLILAHERMHVRRGDLIVNALWVLARCIFWFNPLVHIAGRLVQFDQELACDAAVMRNHPHSRKPYASAMLRTQLVDDPLPLGCHWPANHPLKKRIMLLKQPAARGLRRVIGQMFVGLCVLTVGYGTWAAQSSGVAPPTDTAMTADSAITADSSQSLNGVSGGDASQNPNPARGPVTFEADQTICSADRKSCTWSGHVKVSFKEFVILADEAKANRAKSGFVLVVRGAPATFTHTPTSGAAVTRGAAERIVLDGAAREVRLTGNASLTQGDAATMTGEGLIYSFP
jgi:bla regulator protein blaR1